MWDLRSPTRDQTYTLWTGRQSLNHWTPQASSKKYFLLAEYRYQGQLALMVSLHHSPSLSWFLSLPRPQELQVEPAS